MAQPPQGPQWPNYAATVQATVRNRRRAPIGRREIVVREVEPRVIDPWVWNRMREIQRLFSLRRIAMILLIILIVATMGGAIVLGTNATDNTIHQILITIWFFLAAGIGGFALYSTGGAIPDSLAEEEAPRLRWAIACLVMGTGLAILLEIFVWMVFVGPEGVGWLLFMMLLAFISFGVALGLIGSVPLQAARDELLIVEFGQEAVVPPPLTQQPPTPPANQQNVTQQNTQVLPQGGQQAGGTPPPATPTGGNT